MQQDYQSLYSRRYIRFVIWWDIPWTRKKKVPGLTSYMRMCDERAFTYQSYFLLLVFLFYCGVYLVLYRLPICWIMVRHLCYYWLWSRPWLVLPLEVCVWKEIWRLCMKTIHRTTRAVGCIHLEGFKYGHGSVQAEKYREMRGPSLSYQTKSSLFMDFGIDSSPEYDELLSEFKEPGYWLLFSLRFSKKCVWVHSGCLVFEDRSIRSVIVPHRHRSSMHT